MLNIEAIKQNFRFLPADIIKAKENKKIVFLWTVGPHDTCCYHVDNKSITATYPFPADSPTVGFDRLIKRVIALTLLKEDISTIVKSLYTIFGISRTELELLFTDLVNTFLEQISSAVDEALKNI